MEKNALLSLLLLSLFMFDASHASFIWEHRKLGALDPNDNKNNINKTETPQQNSPPPSQKEPDANPKPDAVVDEKKNKTENPNTKGFNNSTISPDPTPSPKVVKNEKGDHQNGANNATPPVIAPPVAKKDDVKSNEQGKKENEGNALSHSPTDETCDGHRKCNDDANMVACVSKIDPKYLIVLIENKGGGAIKVKLIGESNLGDVEVGQKTEKINISQISSQSTQLTLTAGKGDCVLHVDTLSPKRNFFLRLPSFDKILTPVNGAYFLILMVLVFGATWVCCKLRKKRHEEVPYQELEMAMPESVSTTNVESAEGWDQDWDDDWDDNVAVKPPAAHLAGSISANGLTSRSSNKDGWENNWDD